MSDASPIKCSACKVPAKVFIPDGKTEPDRVICPQCGIAEDYDVVLRSIGEQAQAFAAKELQKVMSGQPTIREDGFLSMEFRFEPAEIEEVAGKFCIDFED